jgi:hypothetical protein
MTYSLITHTLFIQFDEQFFSSGHGECVFKCGHMDERIDEFEKFPNGRTLCCAGRGRSRARCVCRICIAYCRCGAYATAATRTGREFAYDLFRHGTTNRFQLQVTSDV